MKEIHVDREKPLWWVILVIFFIALIYYMGSSPDTDDFTDDISPDLVGNLNGVYR